MAEWTNPNEQTVNPGESIVFTENPVPCNLGLIRHRSDTGSFLLAGRSVKPTVQTCCCRRNQSVNYDAKFSANIAVPADQTAGPISVAVAVDGATIASSLMEATPAAVSEYFNVAKDLSIPIFKGCCQTVTVRNVSSIPILVKAATIVISQ